jgi:hypothetical protein
MKKILAALAFAALAFAGNPLFAAGTTVTVPNIAVGKTAHEAELIGSINNGQQLVVLSYQIPGGLNKGDCIDVIADMQATNPLPMNGNSNNVLFGTQLILATSAAAITGTPLNWPQGVNITPTMHHYGVTRGGYFVASAAMPIVFVNLVMEAASDFVGQNAVALTIDKGYGQITVKKTPTGL